MNPSIILLLFSTLISASLLAKNFISIQKLHEIGVLNAEIKSLGGHSGECIVFDLKNNSHDSLYVWIEAGRRLFSHDPGKQDIFLLRNEEFVLAPGEQRLKNGFGFCCQSHKGGPSKDEGYCLGKMAPDAWVAMANWADQRNISESVLQNAVWVFSNGHDIRSIPAKSENDDYNFREKVAEILDIDLPWYSFGYAEDTTRMFSGMRTHIYAQVPYNVPNRTMITGQVHDKKGKLIYQTPSYHVSRGANIFTLSTSIATWPIGNYTFSIIEDFHTLNISLPITVDQVIEEQDSSYLEENEERC